MRRIYLQSTKNTKENTNKPKLNNMSYLTKKNNLEDKGLKRLLKLKSNYIDKNHDFFLPRNPTSSHICFS